MASGSSLPLDIVENIEQAVKGAVSSVLEKLNDTEGPRSREEDSVSVPGPSRKKAKMYSVV